MGDLLGSVGAIVAALIIIWTGWTPADDSLYSGFGAGTTQRWRLLKDSVNELLEGAPVSLDINALQRHLRSGKSPKSATYTMCMSGWSAKTGHDIARSGRSATRP